MTTAESVIISGEYKNLSYREMLNIAYRDFPVISDDDFKVLFTKKTLDKSNEYDSKDTDVSKWSLAATFYNAGALNIPPWFDDVNWIPTLEDLRGYREEEIDYLVDSAISDENDYITDPEEYKKYHDRAKKIKEVVKEYKNESIEGK